MRPSPTPRNQKRHNQSLRPSLPPLRPRRPKRRPLARRIRTKRLLFRKKVRQESPSLKGGTTAKLLQIAKSIYHAVAKRQLLEEVVQPRPRSKRLATKRNKNAPIRMGKFVKLPDAVFKDKETSGSMLIMTLVVLL